MMTREEHLDWCKARALEYVVEGKEDDAFASMMNDLVAHDELKEHAGIELGMKLMMSGLLNNSRSMKRWIEGFR